MSCAPVPSDSFYSTSACNDNEDSPEARYLNFAQHRSAAPLVFNRTRRVNYCFGTLSRHDPSPRPGDALVRIYYRDAAADHGSTEAFALPITSWPWRAGTSASIVNGGIRIPI